MKNFDDLDRVIEFQTKHNLGNKVVLYHTAESIEQIDGFLSMFNKGTDGFSYTFPSEPDNPVKIHGLLQYSGFEFLIINIDNL